MGLDINSQGLGQQNTTISSNTGASSGTNQTSTSTPTTTLGNLLSTTTDQIATFKSEVVSTTTQTVSNLASNPTLNSTGNTSTSFSAHINETIKNYNLPDGKSLSNQISDPTKQMIRLTLNDLQDLENLSSEMKNFFNMLSKLFPLSLALLEAILGGEDTKSADEIIKQALEIIKDLGKALSENIDKLNLPKEMKDQIKTLASQLMNLGNITDPKAQKEEIGNLLKSLQNLSGNPSLDEETTKLIESLKTLGEMVEGEADISLDPEGELFQKLNSLGLLSNEAREGKSMGQSELNSTMNQLQTSGQSDLAKMFQSLNASLGLLQTLRGLPPQNQSLGMSTFLAMSNIDAEANPSGILGKSLGEFSNNAGKFILGIQEKGNFAEALPRGAEGERLYSTAFSQVMLTAAVLGRMIAQSKAADMSDDAIKVAILKLNSAKDLGIVDQIPFSFMAFFANLSNDGDDLSDAVKAAKNSLLQLIRLLFKLTFILVVIATSGSKLGEKGMNRLLEENSEYITSILDALIFALKKVDEHYVVNVNFHIALLQKGKDALALKDYPEFWVSMIHMYAEKTELFQFLKDMEDAKPLFKTLEAMMSESNETQAIDLPIAT